MRHLVCSTIVLAALLGAGLNPLLARGAPANARQRIEVAAGPAQRDAMPQAPILFPGAVRAWQDVVFHKQPGYRPLTLDIYVPAGKVARPLVVYIHGGGWFAGNTRQSGAFVNLPRVLALLAAEGFTVASIEYRLSGEARFPAQLADVNAALRFLRGNAAKYRIDPARVGLWGGSAGGHLASLTALTCRDTALDPASANDGCVQAAVAWYGISDFATMPRIAERGSPEQLLLGCDGGPCDVPQARQASPVTHVDAKDPPFLLIHGEDDIDVPVGQSRALEAELRNRGVAVRSLYMPGIGHSFIGKTHEATRSESLRAIEATFDFLHERLGPAGK